ncbi:MAG: CHASE2 domain-containing protein [Thermodesulfobacteriota bacterium]|nr:CHASE2 domain-containing protein [Thermodesulfobacteriota bacterium]
MAQAKSEGFFNVSFDPAGRVRRAPLFILFNGVPYPSLALETLRIRLGEDDLVINVSRKVESELKGVVGVTLAGRTIPTDDKCRVYLNYRGPEKSFRYISAADILRTQHDLSSKYVLVGTSAAGLRDLRATPFSNMMPGVEIHATVIDNHLSADPFTHDAPTENSLTYTIIVVGDLLLIAFLAYAGPLAGGLSGVIFFLVPPAFSYYCFVNNRIVGMTYPMLTIAVIFRVVTLSNFFFEGRKKAIYPQRVRPLRVPACCQSDNKRPGKSFPGGGIKDTDDFFQRYPWVHLYLRTNVS